ncbi:MAG: hypothetical protein Q7T82_01605 [Armatimonadota bacterium]|nr:hypothetical protein [Armatimonadota bacterium]
MRRTILIRLSVALAAYLLLSVVVPRLSVFGRQIDLIVFTVIFMAAQMLVIRYICAMQVSFAAGGVIFIASLGAFAGLLAAKHATDGVLLLGLPIDLSRIVAASFLGYLVSFVLRDKNIVLPIAGFAACLDIWTVTWGPTRHMIEKAPKLVEEVSAPIPIPGGHGDLASVIGPADFVFLAVFFGAIYRLKMEPGLTFRIVLPLLCLTMIAVNSTPYFPGIPALVPMGIGVIAANYRHVKFSKQEKWSVIIMSIILTLALAAHLLYRAAR